MRKGESYEPRIIEGYVMLTDIDCFWPKEHLNRIIKGWEEGLSVEAISKQIGNRDPDEIVFLLWELEKKGKIKHREGGVYGWLEQ